MSRTYSMSDGMSTGQENACDCEMPKRAGIGLVGAQMHHATRFFNSALLYVSC